MSAIPKGSSIALPDAAFLGTPSVHSDRCIFCGAAAENNHHQPPKSHVPKECHADIPTFSVCGQGNTSGCHGLAHHNGGNLSWKPTDDPRYVYAIADDRAASDINKRRKRHGMRPVLAHVPFMAQGGEVPFDDDEDTADVFVTARDEINDAQRLEGSLAWVEGDALERVYQHLRSEYSAHEAASRFRDFCTDELEHPIDASTASKRRTFAVLRSEAARSLPPTQGYYAGKAVKEGLLSESEAVSLAVALKSVSDFRAEVWGVTEKIQPTATCPLDKQPCRRAERGSE